MILRIYKYIRKFLRLGLYCLPVLSFATTYDQVSSGLNYFNFTDISKSEDLSMTLLGMIFGNFNDMLPATGYSILTPVLEHFNQGVFVIAVSMVTYVTFLNTIKTAEEGKPMGEKTPIFWMLLRPILGTTMLVPSASGYSYLQSLMMWAIISGVSFANSIWVTVVNTFNVYGSLNGAASTSSSPSVDFNSSAALAQYLFESELCLLGAKKVYDDQQNAVGSSSSGTSVPAPSSNYDNTNHTLTYGNMPVTNYVCGTYNFDKILTSYASGGTYSQDSIEDNLNSIIYNLYLVSQSIAKQEFDTINSLPSTNNYSIICQTDLYTGGSIDSFNCGLGALLANNAMNLKLNLQNLQELTAVAPSNEDINTINYSGGWIMAAAMYYKLVSMGSSSDVEYTYNEFDPQLSFVDNLDDNNKKTQQLCYYSSSYSSFPKVPETNTPCNIVLPENFLQYTDSSDALQFTNWLEIDINGNPEYNTGQNTNMTMSNVPKYMNLYYQEYNNAASSSASNSYSSDFNYSNTYQAQICQPKGWLTQTGDFIVAANESTASALSGNPEWNYSSDNCQTMDAFTTPQSGTVDVTNLPAVLSAQIYYTAIQVFGGQNINSSFQSQMTDLVNKTKSGIRIKGPYGENPSQTTTPFNNSGVEPYGYNQIPQLPSDNTDYAGMVMSGIFSSWDVSGSGSKFYPIFNNYIASILMLWQKSFLNTSAAEPIGAVRDFGIQAVSMSIQFIVAMTQKIYIEQILIMVKYIGWYIFFSMIAMSGNIFQGIIYLVSKIVFWSLLWFFGLGAILRPGIYALAFVPQAVIEPVFNSLANVAIMFLQLEISGTFLWVPMIMSVSVPIMTLAMVLAFYAPMIPFLIWCLSSINWLIGVIESMVAAPVVALGVTSPQGHDFLGKAELCTMLILAVFIRPAAMLIGFIFAVCIAYFGFSIFNYMMFYTMQLYLNTVIMYPGGKGSAVLMGFILLMYCYTVITFINQIFSMIYVIPNKIMRWIGVPVDDPDEDVWLEEIKGGTTDAVSGLAGSATGAAEELSQGGIASSGAGAAEGAKGNMGAQSGSAKKMKNK
jgi:hypothetical protein